jgi:hypothetical protein
VLCGTIRDHDTLQRRPFIRYFACQEDLSYQHPNTPRPDAVLTASEPLIVLAPSPAADACDNEDQATMPVLFSC